MRYEQGILNEKYVDIDTKELKLIRINALPRTIQSLYRMTVQNLRRAPVVIEAPTFELFNRIAAQFGAQADRVKETQPFARFLFVAYATYERETYKRETVDIPVIIFYDLGTDVATWLSPRFFIPKVDLTKEME